MVPMRRVSCSLPFLAVVFSFSAPAQLANPAAIPVGPNPPVIFLNGYQADCKSSTFAGTFGSFDKAMLAFGRQPLFFDNCANTGLVKPSIEELGNTFARFLGALRYTDGTAVTRVDAVAHSMGGLILRSYLAGKQFDGTYVPPATVPIRKMAFLAVPNFGTPVSLGFAADQQLIELSVGSTFVFDLATWNQGIDDLRGVDAFAIAGYGGTGVATGLPRFDDGVVSLESASIAFARANSTRLLPYCHTAPGLITAAALCPPNVPGIAEVAGAADIPAIMVNAFLANVSQVYGAPATENEYLFSAGGLILRPKAADDSYPFISTATANGSKINVRTTQVAFSEYLFPRNQTVSLTTTTNETFMQDITIMPGYVNARTIKKGPVINRVLPSATNVSPLMVGSNSYISIYGTGLDGAVPFSNGVPLTIVASSPTQINAVLTADPTKTAVPITVSSPTGKATVTMLTLPNVPALFTQNASGSGAASALNAVTNALVTPSAPLKQGDYVSLFLTGLTFLIDPKSGATSPAVSVTVGGKACPVQFAGIAPGYMVLDQINCQIPLGVPSSTTVPVVVTADGIVSNTVTLAIQ